MMFPDKVILASKSPRRLELLSLLFAQKGRNVEQIHSLRDEPKWDEGDAAENYLKRCIDVKTLGATEAFDISLQNEGWQLVVAADTIVVLKGEIYGKPDNSAHAVKMLMTMMGQEHRVLTAYSLTLYKTENKKREKKEAFWELLETRVRFRKAPLAEVKAYVKTGEPLDKSGSYGVQGPALQFVESVKGSYQSVMGIPLFEIQKKVNSWKTKYSNEKDLQSVGGPASESTREF